MLRIARMMRAIYGDLTASLFSLLVQCTGATKGNARGGSRRQARADEEWVDDEGIRDDDEEHDDEKTRRGGPQDRRGVFTKRSDPKRSLFPRRGDSTMRRRADKCVRLV